MVTANKTRILKGKGDNSGDVIRSYIWFPLIQAAYLLVHMVGMGSNPCLIGRENAENLLLDSDLMNRGPQFVEAGWDAPSGVQ